MKIERRRINKVLSCFAYFWSIWNHSACITTVSARCDNGFEMTCVWTHSAKSSLRFVTKVESTERYVELTGCNHPDCGTAIIQSPWLRPRNQGVRVTIHFKIYGTSEVYLRLYMMTDNSAQHQIFSKIGNYAYVFPTTWSSKEITIPSTDARHRLVLKAFTPYKEALVAVRDINLDGSIIFSSTTTTTHNADDEETFETNYTNLVEEDDEQNAALPIDYGAENEIENTEEKDEEYDIDEEEDEVQFQALEVKAFTGEEDLTLGYTRVVEPQLCAYKWR